MLDKTVPYAGLFMCRRPGMLIPVFPLPDGYRFSFFRDGDEKYWARIEASVLEFDSEFAALLFFNENFMPYTDELKRRCIFIENSVGDKVATATAWWSYVNGERRPWIHWVGVDPGYQGLGLGKAIIAHATRILTKLEGDVPFFLRTQTWSYKAIGIYVKCGYEPTAEKALTKGRKGDYKRAMKILGLDFTGLRK